MVTLAEQGVFTPYELLTGALKAREQNRVAREEIAAKERIQAAANRADLARAKISAQTAMAGVAADREKALSQDRLRQRLSELQTLGPQTPTLTGSQAYEEAIKSEMMKKAYQGLRGGDGTILQGLGFGPEGLTFTPPKQVSNEPSPLELAKFQLDVQKAQRDEEKARRDAIKDQADLAIKATESTSRVDLRAAQKEQIENNKRLKDAADARRVAESSVANLQSVNSAYDALGSISNLDALISGPGQWVDFTGFGGMGLTQLASYLPTESKTLYALADQAKGKVFLKGYSSVKGAGQITNIEGQKAEQAQTILFDRNGNPNLSLPDSVWRQGLKDMQQGYAMEAITGMLGVLPKGLPTEVTGADENQRAQQVGNLYSTLQKGSDDLDESGNVIRSLDDKVDLFKQRVDQVSSRLMKHSMAEQYYGKGNENLTEGQLEYANKRKEELFGRANVARVAQDQLGVAPEIYTAYLEKYEPKIK